MNCALLLALLTLYAGWVDSFSWDIVKSEEKRLQFYNNGTLTHTEDIPWAKQIYSITYDPVYYRMLFADLNSPNLTISSFDLSTRNIQPLLKKNSNYFWSFAYDPVTQLLFTDESLSIYSFSLNSASSNNAVDQNLIVKLQNVCFGIVVESCGGYIYWITSKEIERAKFDGSEREVLIYRTVHWRLHLTIDQQTQKIYWIDKYFKNTDFEMAIESADFNGQNRETLYIFKDIEVSSLTVSNDFIYWHGPSRYYSESNIWHLPKNHPQQSEPNFFLAANDFYWLFKVIAPNYTIKDQLKGNQKCETLKRLSDSIDVMLCVHGTKVSGEPRCECRQGYIGERCDTSVCQNYCFEGNCSVSAEGQPKCSCKAGYSGQRCEVNACHGYCLNRGVCSLNEADSPVCQCTTGYEGERCGVPTCKDYCLQGNCSVSAEGHPICRCTDGYSGERCEVNACHGYCLNSGVCSLNEEDNPICQCTIEYEGERCGVPTCRDHCLQGNCSVSAEGQPICSCSDGYSGERCEVNACHGYCLNSGVCSLNEEDSPICQCTIEYEGERCGVPICKDYCFQGNCNVSAEGQPICSCTDGYSGERCEFNACHDYCFNNGVCFLNEEEETVCQCTADYEGERCDIAVTHTGVCGGNMTQQILRELRSEVKKVIKKELQSTLHSEVNQVQVIKEDLQRTLRFYSDKNDQNEAKIQKCEKSMKDLEKQSVVIENQDKITSKTVTSKTLSETN